MAIDEEAFKMALNGIPENSYDGNMYKGFVAAYEAAKQPHKHSEKPYKFADQADEALESIAQEQRPKP